MVLQGTNYEGMQAQNRSLILQILSDVQTCTRSELAERTGLTAASITKIVAGMIENGSWWKGAMLPANATAGRLPFR